MTTAAEIDLVPLETDCQRKMLETRTQTPIDPDASRDITVFMTTDGVDGDNEVVLPSGVDFSRWEKNPVILLNHSMGQPGTYGLPVGKGVGPTRRPRGIMVGIVFSRGTEMGREVKALFDEDILGAVSIGFRSIEASPMTREEANSRPDWREAFERLKGRILVHRKILLLEISVVCVPANEDALRVKYKSLGRKIPSWLSLPTPETSPMSDVPTEAAALGGDEAETKTLETAETKCPGKDCPEAKDMEDGDGMETMAIGSHVMHEKGCGKLEAVHTKGEHEGYGGPLEANTANPIGIVDMHERDGEKCMGKCMGSMKAFPMSELKPHMGAKAMNEGSGTAGGYTVKPEDEETAADEPDMDEDDVDDETDEEGGFKAGDHVHFRPHKSHGGVKGMGVVERIHRNGFVGDVDNDMMATPEEPAARVKCYRKMGDGHVPTSTKLGVKLKCLRPMDSPMKPPTKAKSIEPTPTPASKPTTKMAEIKVDPLPPLNVLSDQDLQRLAAEQIKQIPKLVLDAVDRLHGVV